MRFARSHTVEYDPFIKSQLASRNQIEGLMRCKFGHVTSRMWAQRDPRNPPSGGHASKTKHTSATQELKNNSGRLTLLAVDAHGGRVTSPLTRRSAVASSLSRASWQGKRESSLLTTFWSETTLSSKRFGGPASRHGSLNSLFQAAVHLPS